MNTRQRIGLGLLILAACWLTAAPHSEFTSTLAILSLFAQIVGFSLLVIPGGGGTSEGQSPAGDFHTK